MSRPKASDVLPKAAFQQLKVVQTKLRAIFDILRPSEHIFYQSHMRAYTTLVSHILASSDEIDGYLELHRSYHQPSDLVVMRHQVQTASGAGISRSRYKLDKLLHNGNGVSAEIAESPNVKSVFALRRPADTLPSIVAMVQKTGEDRPYGTAEGATEYYVNRVERLARQAEKAPVSLYFDAETVVEDTERLLTKLSSFLQLNQGLSSEYKTFAQTGTQGSGDPSANIKSGTILRNRERPLMRIPSELLQAAEEAYDQSRASLITTCAVTVTTSGDRL